MMNCSIFDSRRPSRVATARRLQMGASAWGAITHYKLDFVKIKNYNGKIRSTALIKVCDPSGKVSIMFEDENIAILFGLQAAEWKRIEQLAGTVPELFYRPFKNGLNESFSPQQQLFYRFCYVSQIKEAFFISYKRMPNVRKGEKTIAFLKVNECSLINPKLLNMFEII